MSVEAKGTGACPNFLGVKGRGKTSYVTIVGAPELAAGGNQCVASQALWPSRARGARAQLTEYLVHIVDIHKHSSMYDERVQGYGEL